MPFYHSITMIDVLSSVLNTFVVALKRRWEYMQTAYAIHLCIVWCHGSSHSFRKTNKNTFVYCVAEFDNVQNGKSIWRWNNRFMNSNQLSSRKERKTRNIAPFTFIHSMFELWHFFSGLFRCVFRSVLILDFLHFFFLWFSVNVLRHFYFLFSSSFRSMACHTEVSRTNVEYRR